MKNKLKYKVGRVTVYTLIYFLVLIMIAIGYVRLEVKQNTIKANLDLNLNNNSIKLR